MYPQPRSPPLFPYTTLFRSDGAHGAARTGHMFQQQESSTWTENAAYFTDRLLRPGGRFLLLEHVADRKSTRLNSSHANISYAVFCLKKKKITRSMSHCADIS